MYTPETSSEFIKVSKTNPCPLCDKPDWCKTSPDNTVAMCPRTDTAPTGWKRIKDTVDGHGIYKLETKDNFETQVSGRRPKKKVSKAKVLPVPAVPIGLKLAKVENAAAPERQPISDTLWSIVKKQILKETPGTSRETVREIAYSYDNDKTVYRAEWTDATSAKGYRKTYRQSHVDDGLVKWEKGKAIWNAYRIDEVLGILGITPVNEPVAPLMLEGEPCVEIARSHGILSTTLQGSNWTDDQIKAIVQELRRVNCQALPYIYDNDETGLAKANKIKCVCDRLQFPCILIDPKIIWPDIPEKGDIKEILTEMSAEEFIRRLEEEIHARAAESPIDDAILDQMDEEARSYGDYDGPKQKLEFNQQALDFLFGDQPWICADGKLYYWTGNHYKYSPDSEQRPRIASYCNSFPVFKREGEGEEKTATFPFANPASAKQVLEWAKMRLEINSDLLNPPGLNCANGVLQLHWDTTAARLAPMPRWELIEHTPDLYYTYQPIATYNPEAVTEHCDRLMEVLSAPQQDIFLKTIAASLDLETVRKYKGRTVKGMLLKGYGSNGKDTLREIVSLMYGRIGMTAATLSDFAAYDDGRKFPLARTANSRVNWASENAQTARLDKIQSLKAFITGDTLSREGKGKDEEDFTPKAIAVFNCNDTPNMQGSLEAIKSRYAVLTFDKTFKVKADPTRGEIEADPRFKYDPEFLKSEVLPAFLNKALNALESLMADGIDYTATEAAMAAIQAENSHLFQFAQDTGLDYSPDDTLTASDIWARLEQWYQDNGTLVYETGSNDKVKAVWLDQPKRGDSNVKGVNQVLARIQQLFPKAARTTVYNATSKRSVAALSGIGFVETRTSSAPVPHHHPHQETLTNQDLRTTRTSFSNFGQNQEILEEVETETEADLENLADNFPADTVKPAKTGAGGAESLEIKDFSCGTGAGIGAGSDKTGAGRGEKPIAPPEPETAPTAPTPPTDAPIALSVQKSTAAEIVNQIVAALRKAIAENDAGAIKKEIAKTKKRDNSKGQLLLEVKACLTDTEKEACKAAFNPSKPPEPPEPATIPTESQTVESPAQPTDTSSEAQPEPAEPAPEPTESQTVESPVQPTDTSSEAQPEPAELATETAPTTEPEPELIALPAETPEIAPAPETALTPEPELAEPAPTPTPELEPIETLNLSVRAYTCLKRAQINTIQQLLTYTPQSLLKLGSVGQITVDEVVDRLQKLGFSLALEVSEDAE